MAGAKFSIELEGTELVQQRLNELLQRGSNLQPVFASIGEHLERSHDQRFRDQKSPDGIAWAPLSEQYREKKKQNKDIILKLNDHLGREFGYQASGRELLFGTKFEYGALHQFGGTSDMPAGPAAVPARPWLGVSDDDIDVIAQMLGDFLMDN